MRLSVLVDGYEGSRRVRKGVAERWSFSLLGLGMQRYLEVNLYRCLA